jgi:transglutaminase-like putative cysteine protease
VQQCTVLVRQFPVERPSQRSKGTPLKRREFLETIAVGGAFVALPSAARARTDFDPQPGEWRQYEVVTRIELKQPAGLTRAWVPVPSMNESDWIRSLSNEWAGNARRAALVSEGKYDAKMVAAEWGPDSGRPVLSVTSRIAVRDRATDFGHRDPGLVLDPATKRFYTEPTELLPTDGIVRRTALEITAGTRSDQDKARAIYDWIVDNTFREPTTRGCGNGDIEAMLESGDLGGKCADLNSLFVGLARACGLPARDVYGLRVAPSRFGYKSLGASSPDVTRAQHCRAEVWLTGLGWVPVDPADVRKVILEEPPGKLALDDRKVTQARSTLFGAWEMNWLPYNTAHDIKLPDSQGVPVPFLMYPQGESAQARFDPLDPDSFRYTITARALST